MAIAFKSLYRPRGRWAAVRAAARKDLDNDHTAATTRARRTMIARGVRIDCVLRYQRIDLWYWRGHQLLGSCNVGLQSALASSP
jgi:hypothetical protein